VIVTIRDGIKKSVHLKRYINVHNGLGGGRGEYEDASLKKWSLLENLHY